VLSFTLLQGIKSSCSGQALYSLGSATPDEGSASLCEVRPFIFLLTVATVDIYGTNTLLSRFNGSFPIIENNPIKCTGLANHAMNDQGVASLHGPF